WKSFTRSPSSPASASSFSTRVPCRPTVAPCACRMRAIASPMPPDAPVIKALRPVSENMCASLSHLSERSQRGLDFGRGADVGGGDVAVDAAGKTLKHLPRADFVQRGNAVGGEPLDRFAPAHPTGH